MKLQVHLNLNTTSYTRRFQLITEHGVHVIVILSSRYRRMISRSPGEPNRRLAAPPALLTQYENMRLWGFLG